MAKAKGVGGEGGVPRGGDKVSTVVTMLLPRPHPLASDSQLEHTGARARAQMPSRTSQKVSCNQHNRKVCSRSTHSNTQVCVLSTLSSCLLSVTWTELHTESETQYHARTPYMNPSNAPPCTAVQPAPPPPPRAPKDSAHCTLHRPWLTLRRRVRAPVASAETIVGACPVRWRHRVRWRQHHKHARAALD